MGNSIFQTKIGGVAMKQYHVWGGLHSFELVSIWFEMPPPSRVQSRWITLNHAGITPTPPRSFLGVFWGPNHAQSRPITPNHAHQKPRNLLVFSNFWLIFDLFSWIFEDFSYFLAFSTNFPGFGETILLILMAAPACGVKWVSIWLIRVNGHALSILIRYIFSAILSLNLYQSILSRPPTHKQRSCRVKPIKNLQV